MKLTSRECCPVCSSPQYNDLVSTPPLVIQQGLTTDLGFNDMAAEQHWVECAGCKSVYLLDLPPIELVYRFPHAASFGELWSSHHLAFSHFIDEFCEADFHKFVEIGGGNGALASVYYENHGSDQLKWTNIDPTDFHQSPFDGYSHICDLITEEASLEQVRNTSNVVLSHVLEHFYEPRKVLSAISAKQVNGGRIFLSWPTFEHWISEGYAGALNWEHSFACSVENLIRLMSEYNYKLLGQSTFRRGHSTFFCFEKGLDQVVRDWGRTIKFDVPRFFSTIQAVANNINENIRSARKHIFITPASVYTQYLVSYGMKLPQGTVLIDSDPKKIGKRLCGTRLIVDGYSKHSTPSVVVVTSAVHAEEICDTVRRYFEEPLIVTIDE